MKNTAQLNRIIFSIVDSAIDKETKGQQYFALKNYCLENMVLLSRKEREYCLKGLAKKVKEAQKTRENYRAIYKARSFNLGYKKQNPENVFFKPRGKKKYSLLDEAGKCELKSFKVLIEVRAYNEEDMREIVEQANNPEIEWFCECGN